MVTGTLNTRNIKDNIGRDATTSAKKGTKCEEEEEEEQKQTISDHFLGLDKSAAKRRPHRK